MALFSSFTSNVHRQESLCHIASSSAHIRIGHRSSCIVKVRFLNLRLNNLRLCWRVLPYALPPAPIKLKYIVIYWTKANRIRIFMLKPWDTFNQCTTRVLQCIISYMHWESRTMFTIQIAHIRATLRSNYIHSTFQAGLKITSRSKSTTACLVL